MFYFFLIIINLIINSLSGAIEAHQTSNLGVVGSSPTWDDLLLLLLLLFI